MRGETYLGVAVALTRVGLQKTDDTSPFANSSIFKWNATANKFAGPIQLIPSEGGCDFTYFEIDGDSFVFVSNSFRPYFKVYNNATTTQVFPEVLKWSAAAGQFVHHQKVMTAGTGYEATDKSIFVTVSPSEHFFITSSRIGWTPTDTNVFRWNGTHLVAHHALRNEDGGNVCSSSVTYFLRNGQHMLIAIGWVPQFGGYYGLSVVNLYIWNGTQFQHRHTLLKGSNGFLFSYMTVFESGSSLSLLVQYTNLTSFTGPVLVGRVIEHSSGNVSVEKVQEIMCGGALAIGYVATASTEYILVNVDPLPGAFLAGDRYMLYSQSVSTDKPSPTSPNVTTPAVNDTASPNNVTTPAPPNATTAPSNATVSTSPAANGSVIISGLQTGIRIFTLASLVIPGTSATFASQTTIAMASLECRYDVGVELTWVLHPTGWDVGGTSPYLGAVIANTAIVAATYALHLIAYAVFGDRVRGLLMYTDTVYAHFEVAILTSAAHVLLSPSTHPAWACVVCAVVALVCVGTRVWALWRAVGTAKYVKNAPREDLALWKRLFLPRGTWRGTSPDGEVHVKTFSFLYKDLTPRGMIWLGLYHQMIVTVTLAGISGWIPRSHADCVGLSVSYGVVYFLHAVNVAVRRPYSATWDFVAGIMSPILVCAAIVVAQSGLFGQDGMALDVATCIIAVMAGIVTVVSVAVWFMKKFAPKEKDAIDEDAVEMDVKEEPLIEKATKAHEDPPAVPAKAAPIPKKANPKAATFVHDFEL